MMRIPVKFERVAAAFGQAGRVRSCESSGSEHSADLSDLVNSFFEREIREQRKREDYQVDFGKDENGVDEDDDDEVESNSRDFESRDSLRDLFEFENDAVKRSVHAEVEKAYREIGGGKSSSPDFNRRLMSRLRSAGFDAGLCKSKWEKNGRCPPGNYEYVDVNACGTRYIIEIHLAGEFTFARPTGGYASLLEDLPQIFVGKPDELKQVVRIMCRAIKRSMKSVGIHVPPWRRLVYMQSKWFGSYKRTTNEIPSWKAPTVGGGAGKKTVGFAAVEGIRFYCREDFAAKNGVRIGNLAKEMLL
ncbi:UNVERIFIED_CONTAM: hypothetical protein Sangu_2371100 [Sesamum angustifolium]|uniref:DUF506 family protein n=1 Tax=Sesamum angustifolium TaxID=2727405 RepID=A0AAW2KWK6_9LAMI